MKVDRHTWSLQRGNLVEAIILGKLVSGKVVRVVIPCRVFEVKLDHSGKLMMFNAMELRRQDKRKRK